VSNPIRSIEKGETLSFTFDRGGESIAGYTCEIEVVRFPGDTPPISRFISEDPNSSNPQWASFLTKTETAALALVDTDQNKSTGLYRIIASILNTATGDLTKAIVPIRFNLTTAW